MNNSGTERATVVVGTIMAAISLSLYVLITLSVWNFSTLKTSAGYPLATDFSVYWCASKLALSGQAALAYNIDELHKVQLQFFGPNYRYGKAGWFYPPYYFFIALPLGLLPYLASLTIWLLVTFGIYLIVLSRLSPQPVFIPLCITFPGILENILFGQNGLLSGALIGGGLLLLGRLPVVAGILFGLMSYKPHLLILTIIALLFGRCWKTLISTIITFLILVLLSIAIFGQQVWMAYFGAISIPMKLLTIGAIPWSVVPTFFSAILSAGFGVKIAYIVQGAVMLAVMVGVAWVWRKGWPLAIRGAVLLLGTLLFTPYAFTYDLAILALALGWLWEDGRLHGRLPGEILLLMVEWFMPVAAPFLWDWVRFHQARLQIGPEILAGLFLLALLKARIARQPQEMPD
jgi:hypothetical protein